MNSLLLKGGIDRRWPLVGWGILLLAILAIGLGLLASLASAVDSGSGGIQGYAADQPIESGIIVQLTGKDSGSVKPARQADVQRMFGLAVDPQSLSVKLSQGSLENEVFVAVSGAHKVLVSTQGGAIAAGDYLTLSAIDGVAMKAGFEEPTVFGRAISSFDGKGVVLGSTTLKDTDGKANQQVKLGSVTATIAIQRNPNEKSTKAKVPELLERIGQAIAEKEVDPIRIYLSLAITAASLVTAIIVIYSGVKNSIISIGRNPMSKKSIFRALLEIILTSLLILIIGLFAVYLLLKL